MTPDEQPRNPKPDRKYYDSDQDYELAMWVWKQEVKNARAAARFNNKVDEKFNTKPTSDGESAINPSTPPQSPEQPVEQPTKPSKQKRAEILAETKKDSPPSTAQEPDAVKPDKTINAPIEDIKPESEKTRSKRRNSLNPIKKQLANISTNASKSARNSGVVRTQILGPIHERLLNLGASIRHATTRINQSERNLEEKIGKISDIAKDVRSENGKLFDRLKSLRNIGNISRGVSKLRKRIDGINERTKVINKNVKVLATQPTDVEPQHQPGIMEMLWTGLGTKLGLVKSSGGNAALKNVRGTGNKAKSRVQNPRMSKIPNSGELPSQLGIEAKNIYDRYTSPWSTGTKSRILANMVMPGVTALPALARSITGTSKGRGLFKKRNKGKQDVSNAEKAEIKQDKSEQSEDLLEKLKNTVFKVRIVEGDDSLLLTGKKDKKDENGEDGLLKTLAGWLSSNKMMSTIMSYITGPALGAIGTAVLAIVASPVFLAGAAVAVGYILGKVMEELNLVDKLYEKFPALKEFVEVGTAGFMGALPINVQTEDKNEARNAFVAELAAGTFEENWASNTPPSKINQYATIAREFARELRPKYDKMRADGDSESKIKGEMAEDWQKFLEAHPGGPLLHNTVGPKIMDAKPIDNDTFKRMHDNSGILKNNTINSSDYIMFNPNHVGLFNDTSKKIEENTKQEAPSTPISVNSVSNNVSTNNSSPTLLAPQSMFDAKQSYSRFGWLYT